MNCIKLPIATCTIFSFIAAIFASPYEVEYAMAQSPPQENEISIPAIQAAVSQQGKAPEDVNFAMRSRFPKTSFPYYEPAEGCTAPFPTWNRVFENACNNHDICYTTPGNGKELCDTQMLREMLTICASERDSSSQQLCNTWARRYHDALDTNPLWLVSRAFNTAQRKEREYIAAVYDWLNSLVSLAGTWQSDWGPVTFNSNLTGSWNQGEGKIGQIQRGTYDPQTRRLVFHYYQSWNDMNGTATLTLSQDRNQLSGTWSQQRGANSPGSGGAGTWIMRRSSSQ